MDSDGLEAAGKEGRKREAEAGAGEEGDERRINIKVYDGKGGARLQRAPRMHLWCNFFAPPPSVTVGCWLPSCTKRRWCLERRAPLPAVHWAARWQS